MACSVVVGCVAACGPASGDIVGHTDAVENIAESSDASNAPDSPLEAGLAEQPIATPAEYAFYSPPQSSLTWGDLASAGEADLAESTTTLVAANQAEQPVVMDLTLFGDRGTTRGMSQHLGAVEISAGGTETIEVDLQQITLGANLHYSGAALVRGQVSFKGASEDIESITSPMLYFHPSDAGMRIYDETRLEQAYRSGDVHALQSEVDPTDPTGDRIARVVEYESPSDEELTIEFSTSTEEADPDGGASVHSEPLDRSTSRSPASVGRLEAESDAQLAVNHKLCVNFKVLTNDSGFANSVGKKEDKWVGANNGAIGDAHYVRVKIGATDYDTASNGCVTFQHSQHSVSLGVRVYAFAQDPSGNLARIHDGPPTDTSGYPSSGGPSTYSEYYASVSFVGGTTTTLNAGGYSARWTAMGALAKSLFRYGDGLANTQFHVAEDSNCANVAINYHNNVTGNRSYISIPGSSCSGGTSLRAKFLVAHEYGHAYLHQRSNAAETLPANVNATPSAFCSSAGSFYANNSEEWSSIAFREGYAHFISARVWNNKAGDGQFRWNGSAGSTDLERWDAASSAGGWLVNICCGGYSGSQFDECVEDRDGHGTIGDWLRAIWDLHTPPSGCTMSKHDMGSVYGLTLIQSGLTNGGFFPAVRNAVAWFGSGCLNRWDGYGCHNGIDRQGAPWSGC